MAEGGMCIGFGGLRISLSSEYGSTLAYSGKRGESDGLALHICVRAADAESRGAAYTSGVRERS